VTLETVSRCMPAGILIGVVVLIFSLQHSLLPAYALLMLIGMSGGFFVVPLNALLQERGKKSVGAGNAIAVQNLGENSAMLLMLGIYSLAVLVGIPVVAIGIGFGAVCAGDCGAVDLAAPPLVCYMLLQPGLQERCL
jgi:LPLT family lysophospholipid transporter-like MFS transporter